MEQKIGSWEWFGLSYASWLVLPRIALQSMPDEWQHKFFEMVGELEDRIEFPEGYHELEYVVSLRKNGKFTQNPLPPYRHNSLKVK